MLNIQITSFSYGKGYPQDLYGHGGGFVFDCRCIKNPGLIDGLNSLTGNDNPVSDYLETETEMPRFLAAIKTVLMLAINDYLQKGYGSLSVSFGCTGGKHRSVYAAQQTEKWALSGFNGKVSVIKKHRELTS